MADIKINALTPYIPLQNGYLIPLANESTNSPAAMQTAEVQRAFALNRYEKPSSHDLGLYWYSNNTDFVIGKAGLYLMLKPSGITLMSPGTIVLQGTQLTLKAPVTTDGFSMQTLPAASGKSVTSDAFLYWPSFSHTKTDILPISAPLDKLKKVRGLTYKKDGVDDAGFVVEDLDSVGIPGLIQKEGTSIKSFSLRPVLALLVECVKAILERLDALEKEAKK